MIARLWTATTSRENAPRYASHLQQQVLPLLHRIPGYEGGTLLEREQGTTVEVMVLTWWRSLDDIRAFAGGSLDHAVVSDEARRLLDSFDSLVRHFRVVHDEDFPAANR